METYLGLYQEQPLERTKGLPSKVVGQLGLVTLIFAVFFFFLSEGLAHYDWQINKIKSIK